MAKKEGTKLGFAVPLAATSAAFMGVGVNTALDTNAPTGAGIGQFNIGAISTVQQLNALGIISDKVCKILSGVILSANSVPVVMGIMDILNNAVMSGVGQICLGAFSGLFAANELGLFDEVKPWKKKKALAINQNHVLDDDKTLKP